MTSDNPFAILVYPSSWGNLLNSTMTVNGEQSNPWMNAGWITSLPATYNAARVSSSIALQITNIIWKK